MLKGSESEILRFEQDCTRAMQYLDSDYDRLIHGLESHLILDDACGAAGEPDVGRVNSMSL